jgi:tetratricopeptide (TPR) repeat protein
MPRTGPIDEALRHAQRLLARDAGVAALQAEAILEAAPAHPQALLILATARARQGNTEAARAILEPLAQTQPRAAAVHFEYGKLLAELGETAPAIAALRHAVTLKPDLPQAWRALADLHFLAGQTADADAAYARHLREAVHDPALMAAGDALVGNDLPRAEHLLRAHLKRAPTDVAALRMLAEVGTRLGRYAAAETLLERALELAPGFHGARYNYAIVLFRQNRAIDALAQMRTLIAAEPRDPSYRLMYAACLATTGGYDESIAIYAELIKLSPHLPRLWSGYGHVLRTAGRREEAIAAYRRIIALAPATGEAWWSLANLKTGVLSQADVARMRQILDSETLSNEDRLHLHYALGRTLEEAGDYAQAFAHYAEGAQLRRPEVSYDADATAAQIDRTIALATPAFFAARAGFGCPDGAPIFVIGLPRSGSTLIEQMLSSHPLVEGTMELPELANVARELTPARNYPECLAEIAPERLAAWGERYLERCRPYRRTERPFFIDKMPNNWVHAALIALILPNARIIDARRHAMATCFSTFKQHFARGQNYSYDLKELGRYYTEYLRLMAALDQALPGRIHRVQYETMVDQTEAELRRLLAYCGLAYDPACLAFHQNPRPVRTASSEQVRRPIFREGLEHWRNFEPWLGELKQALSTLAVCDSSAHPAHIMKGPPP